ncbi:MAG: hypothetical protein J6P61_02280 [Erysipelotrichaceae bacterium]|nr:hypothetical protein [Erysipelotrichaceae bacterium]
MEFMIVLLAIFIVVLLTFTTILFEISRSRALKLDDLSWFLTLEKPFTYTRTGYMVFICAICYMFNGVGTRFSAGWFLYMIIFIACGVVADALVQYIVLQYGRMRCRKQIEAAKRLDSDLVTFGAEFEEDHNYILSAPRYDEVSMTKSIVSPQDHLAFMTVDQGEFVKAYGDYPQLTYDVEPFGNIEDVKANLADLPVRATQLTSDRKMPFKNDRIDVLMNEYANYDKFEIQRVLKPGGYYIVNQYGSENLKEVTRMFLPIGFKNSWDSQTCAQTLHDIGFDIVDQREDLGYVRFTNINQMRTYFKNRIPELSQNVEKFKAIYMNALEHMKANGYYEMTTHRFLVVAKNNHQPEYKPQQ